MGREGGVGGGGGIEVRIGTAIAHEMLLTTDGQVLVADFGIARALGGVDSAPWRA